jgi:hypothetical protein
VIWILGITGILLTLLGLWGGPARPRKRREMETLARKQPATPDEAWDILVSPMVDEAIKLPEHKPWYMPGGDRRFMRGVFVGLGAGLMVATVTVSMLPRAVTPPTTAETEKPTGVETAKNAPPQQAPATQSPAAVQPATQQPVTQPPTAEAPKPANMTFVVEPGELAPTIAAHLKAQGLIADEQAFLDRVTELGADRALQSGTFVVPTGANMDQVIDALTS